MKNLDFIWMFALICMMPSCSSSQKIAPVPGNQDYDILESVRDIDLDNLQNIYILNNQNKVVKYTESLERQYDYSNNLIGEIESIDATNPQKILCFVKDFNRILVLDNTLAEINTIDLSTTEYLDVSAVARTNDNQIWLFDPINQALVKVNDLVESQYSSNRLADLNLGMIEPVYIREKGNRVVMSDPVIGLLVFDNFGQFIKLIPEKGIEHFQIFGEYLFFTQNGESFQYHIKRFEKTKLSDLPQGHDRFFFTKAYTYFVDEDGVVVLKN